MLDPRDFFLHLHPGCCGGAQRVPPGRLGPGVGMLSVPFLPVVKIFVELQQAVKSNFWGGRSRADTD